MGMRFLGEKRVSYDNWEESAQVYNSSKAGLSSIAEDEVLSESDRSRKANTSTPTGLPIYHELLKSIMAQLPKSMKPFTHMCVPDFSQSTERQLAAFIAGLMRHVNAPFFHKACCRFHSTAIHISFALGRLLARPCKPMCMPTTQESRMCDTCGFIVCRHGTCQFCAVSTSAANSEVSDLCSNAMEFVEFLVTRRYFTKFCCNAMRHTGTTDLTRGIELLIAAAVDLSTQPEWQESWEKHPPCDDWTWICPVCHARSTQYSRVCCICGETNEISSSSSSSSLSARSSS